MEKKRITIIAVLTMVSAIASAELVASLHLNVNDDAVGVIATNGLRTRVSGGDTNTQGIVEGQFSFLAGGTEADYAGTLPQINSYGPSMYFKDIDRYPGTGKQAVLVWDYDLSGITSNAWDLKVDFSDRNTVDSDEWYISFTGLGRTLDTTDVTTLTPGTGQSILADGAKYVKIGELPAGSDDAAVYRWDLTEIIEAAQASDGKVRLVYNARGFRDDLRLYNDSGIIATDVSTGDPVNLDFFYISDNFETGSGKVPLNGWTESGPEPKEYNNPTNGPGVLNVRDLNADEKGTGVHKGYFETVTYALENGITLGETNDWFQLQMDVGIYQDDSGADLPGGRNLRISFVDTSAPSNSGFGFLLQTSTNSNWSEVHSFDNQTGYGPNLDGTGYAHPFDGSLAPLFMKVTKVAGGYDIEASWGGSVFDITTVSNSLAQTFDTLTVTAGIYDFAYKLDNVYLVSNVKPVTFTPFEQWAIDSGLTLGVNDGPGDNPDSDFYDNWGEYVVGGDPTNGLNIGIQPEFDAASGGFVYTVRNDTTLNASILTRTDLVFGDWTTNAGAVITLGDGGLTSYTNAVGTTETQQFIKLLVE